MSYQTIDPFTNESVKKFDEHSDAQVTAAIATANDSDYGLVGSVFTQDVERGK